MINKVCCPACGHPRTNSDRQISSVTKDRSLPGFSYTECQSCGTLYNTNNMSADYLTKYHADFWFSSEFFSYGERTHVDQVEQLKIQMFDVLSKCQIGQGVKHLDLGSGEGQLCEALRQLGLDTIGIEPSEAAILTAKTRYPEIKFIHGSIERFLPNSDKFKVITLLDVLEHVSDPESVLLELVKHIEDDGAIVASFPISNSLQLDYLNEYANLFMPPFHNTLFSKTGFYSLCEKVGLKIFHVFPTIKAYGYTKALAEKLNMLDDYKGWRESKKFKKFDFEIDNWFENIAETIGKPQTFFCALKKSTGINL